MADWYVSSAVYAGLTKWAATTAYTVGQIIKPLTTPAFSSEYVFRCTTAGTSAGTEPSWPSGNNGTVTNGGAVFTNVSGQSAYGWSAAAGTLACLVGRSSFIIAGERIFLSSDHADAWTSGTAQAWSFSNGVNSYGAIHCISVNRAGSVPPVAADEQSGAALIFTASGASQWTIALNCDLFMQGIAITIAGSGLSGGGHLTINNNTRKLFYLKNGSLNMTHGNTSGGGSVMIFGGGKIVLENSTIQLSNAIHYLGISGALNFVWLNTPSAVQGTIPNALFAQTTSGAVVTMRGVDLSALTTTLLNSVQAGGGQSLSNNFLLDGCKIAPGMTRFQMTAGNFTTNSGDEVELVNCWDGTNVINERNTVGGSVNTERAGYLVGGAADDIGPYSLKLFSNANIDRQALTLDCFPFDVENTVTGLSKTATVEIIATEAFNNDDISLLLEYMGTAGNSVASFIDSLPTPLTASVALATSSAAWSGPPDIASSWNLADQIGMTFSNANLTVTATGTATGARNIFGFPNAAGKYYWECTMTTWTGGGTGVGICSSTVTVGSLPSNSTNAALELLTSGNIWINSVNVGNLGTRASGNIIGIAVDLAANLIWFRVCPSGNWNNSGTANPATGAGGFSITSVTGLRYPCVGGNANNDQVTANFGASTFSGTMPSGFSNLPLLQVNIARKLQAIFTPQRAGRLRGLVRVRKVGARAWINPQIAIT